MKSKIENTDTSQDIHNSQITVPVHSRDSRSTEKVWIVLFNNSTCRRLEGFAKYLSLVVLVYIRWLYIADIVNIRVTTMPSAHKISLIDMNTLNQLDMEERFAKPVINSSS